MQGQRGDSWECLVASFWEVTPWCRVSCSVAWMSLSPVDALGLLAPELFGAHRLGAVSA